MHRVVFHNGLRCISQSVWSLYALNHQCDLCIIVCFESPVQSVYALSHQHDVWMLWVTGMISVCFETPVQSLYALSHQCDLWMLWVTRVISVCFETPVQSVYALSHQCDLWMLWVTGVISVCFESPVWPQNAILQRTSCDFYAFFLLCRDIDGAVVRPLPRVKRILSDATCLPHIVQVGPVFFSPLHSACRQGAVNQSVVPERDEGWTEVDFHCCNCC